MKSEFGTFAKPVKVESSQRLKVLRALRDSYRKPEYYEDHRTLLGSPDKIANL